VDDAPGEAFDKVARRLKLRHLGVEFASISGGQAIEKLAEKGNFMAFEYVIPMSKHRDCNFSFSGLKSQAQRHIETLEAKHELKGPDMIPQLEDMCASFQHAIFRHLAKRMQRAIEYVELQDWVPNGHEKLIVLSGGVACNGYLRKQLAYVAEQYEFKLKSPPPKLCTDNGIMIAWNGVEKLKRNLSVIQPENLPSALKIEPYSAIGPSVIADVRERKIKIGKHVKLNVQL